MATEQEIAKAETQGANTKAQLKAKAEAEAKARELATPKNAPKMDETIEGGIYTVNGVVVNADGEPL